MVDTAGTKLKRARKSRKLSLEDASRATKIRVNQLTDLEADEYSNFANLAYAKSFFLAYAKYLHVDARPYRDGFTDAGTFGLDDYQYLSESPVGIYRAPRHRQIRPRPKRQQLVLAAMALGMLTIMGVVWFAAVSYQRLGGDLDKLAARQEARERAATESVNQPPAAVAPVQGPALAVPAAEPVNNSVTPAPSVAPMEEAERAASAALASVDVTASGVRPVLPMLGDGNAVRQVLQPLAKHPVAALNAGHLAAAAPGDGSQPQKVVNSQPRE